MGSVQSYGIERLFPNYEFTCNVDTFRNEHEKLLQTHNDIHHHLDVSLHPGETLFSVGNDVDVVEEAEPGH